MIEVRETFLNGRTDTPKSDAGERVVAIGERLASELFDHRARSEYRGEDEYVFCSPSKGTAFDVERYAKSFRKAQERAGIAKYLRPFHDQRRTNITQSRNAGIEDAAVQARAGHADFRTTQGYWDRGIDPYREAAAKIEERLLQKIGTGIGTGSAVSVPIWDSEDRWSEAALNLIDPRSDAVDNLSGCSRPPSRTSSRS